MSAPVLFLVFNRPDTTSQVFEAIKAAKPARLYVAADGARKSKAGEARLCDETRRIATMVDWDCEVKTLFRDENLGCRLAVSGALDWFFAAEEYGVILEDDCLPSVSWFPFAHEMLEKYKYDERIMCISANHFCDDSHFSDYSYFVSYYAHCWGWASWRRAWMFYDHSMQSWPTLRKTDFLKQICNDNRLITQYWTNIFDIAYEGIKVDSWAYRWLFSCWSNKGLTIMPMKNLVVNIGVGQDATHTQSVNSTIARVKNEELLFPLKHPPVLSRDVEADFWESRYVYNITFKSISKSFVRDIPIVGNLLVSINKLLAKLIYTEK
jgi:hypothetical protein